MSTTASVTAFFLAAHSQSATTAPLSGGEAQAFSLASPLSAGESTPRRPRIEWVGRAR